MKIGRNDNPRPVKEKRPSSLTGVFSMDRRPALTERPLVACCLKESQRVIGVFRPE
jgi:hypothetical protein